MNPQIDARYDNGLTGHKRLDGPLKLGGSAFGGQEKTPPGIAPAGFLSGHQSLCGDQKLYFTPNTAPRSPKNLPSKALL
jgi:hypothetical protein